MVTMRRPGLTLDVTWVLPVMFESMEDGVGDCFKDAGVIVDVEEDRVDDVAGAVKCVSFNSTAEKECQQQH